MIFDRFDCNLVAFFLLLARGKMTRTPVQPERCYVYVHICASHVCVYSHGCVQVDREGRVKRKHLMFSNIA